ncbi:MAG: GNAT family N-acetyltransferase [Sphingomonadales bacterium]|nr:GNAT family N-acetyltransferase [Sphingomonadales bacterium]
MNAKPVTIAGQPAELRPLRPTDAEAVRAFAEAMPPHDLLFLARDIRKPPVIAAWLDQIAGGQISSQVIADSSGRVLACTALVRDELSWSRHVAEVRILIAPEARGGGLGRRLALECVQQAREGGVEKLFVRLTPDQEGALYVFQDMGFVPEALLRDHVRDADGATHDIVILALNLARQGRQQAMFGLGE